MNRQTSHPQEALGKGEETGTIPVVHKTGGLADTVWPFDEATGRGTGFVFEQFERLVVESFM